MNDGLTPRQAQFIEAYTDKDGPAYLSAQKAAKVAYNPSSDNSAKVMGYTVLHNPKVQASLQERLNSPDLWDSIQEGVKNVLTDTDHTRYRVREYADILRIWGDLSGQKKPEMHLHGHLPKANVDEQYEQMVEKMRKAELQIEAEKKEVK